MSKKEQKDLLINLQIIEMRKLLLLCRFPQWLVNNILPYSFDDIKQAIIKSDIQAINRIMQSQPKFGEDDNLLMFALKQAKQQVILHLIQQYPQQLDFQRRNQKGDSPLMVAIFRKKRQVFNALLPYSQVNACDFFRNTPFIAAAANGDIEALIKLIENPKTNINAKNSDGHTALHRSCYFGEIQTIDWLINNARLKIGQLDRKGNNALHIACSGAQIATTRYLVAKVKNSSQLLVPNHEGKTPMDILLETLRKLGGFWRQSELQLNHLDPKQ